MSTRGPIGAGQGALAGLARGAGQQQASSGAAIPRAAPHMARVDGHRQPPTHLRAPGGTVTVSHTGTLKLGALRVSG